MFQFIFACSMVVFGVALVIKAFQPSVKHHHCDNDDETMTYDDIPSHLFQ